MEQFLATLAHTADGVYAVDQAQHIIFWNGAAEQILGYSADETIGQKCYELFHDAPRPGCLECRADCPVIGAAGRQETVPTYNLLTRTKAGDTILLNISVIVPQDESNSISTIHLFRDATQQLRYETYVEHILCAAARLPSPLPTLDSRHDPLPPFYAPLSGREKEVLYLLVQGLSPRGIASSLCISYATVRNHLQKILRKLGVHSQREAVKMAIERQLV